MTELIGLILNFVGSLVVAFSVIENPGGGYQQVRGRKILLASILVTNFRWGIALMAIGFLLQILPEVL